MAFDFSREFNRLYSQDASDLIGGIHQIEREKERRLAGAALANIAKIKQAEIMKDKGYYAAPQMMQQRSPGWGDTLLGGLASGISGGIRGLGQQMAWNNERYGSPSLTPFRGELPSTTVNPTIGGNSNFGGGWSNPAPTPPPLPPIGP